MQLLYSYYILQLQTWCSSIPLIHGLWPQTTASTYPENCNAGPVYDKNIEKVLFPELNRTWYDCSTDQSMHLWEHEYTKHLLCIPNVDQKEIFSKIMNLYDNLDLSTTELSICYDLDFKAIDCKRTNFEQQ